MDYYTISLSAEPDIIGVNNGIFQVEIDDNLMKNDPIYTELLSKLHITNKINYEDSYKYIQEIENFTFYAKKLRKAKLTDIIGYSPFLYLFKNAYSKEFIKIISDFNIGDYKDFELIIKNEKEKYFLRSFKRIRNTEIDFSETYFDRRPWYTDLFKLNNPEEVSKDYSAHVKILTLPKKYSDLDIISTQINHELFFSSRLVDCLMMNNITGLNIRDKNKVKLTFS